MARQNTPIPGCVVNGTKCYDNRLSVSDLFIYLFIYLYILSTMSISAQPTALERNYAFSRTPTLDPSLPCRT